jgi:hypothetical protein
MKILRNNGKAVTVCLLAALFFAVVGVWVHGCSMTEFGDIKLTRMAITPGNASILSGATVTLKAEGTYSDTTRKDITAKVTWQSSDPVVTIDETGLATAGTVTADWPCVITATGPDGITEQTTLTVKPLTADAFQLIVISSPRSITIARTTSVQFTATGTQNDGRALDLTSAVTWTSSAPGVVDVDSSGLATALSAGSADIRAVFGTKSSWNSVTVFVSSVSLVSISVQAAAGSGATINQGTTAQFKAIGTFSDQSTQNMSASVIWASSDTTVADISQSGLATAKNKNGTTGITATFNGITSDPVTLTVSGAALQSLAISSSVAGNNIIMGNTRPVTATATYTDNGTQDVTLSVVWTSSDPAVAEVVQAAGSVGIKGVNAGTVTITASMGGKTATADFVVVTDAGY